MSQIRSLANKLDPYAVVIFSFIAFVIGNGGVVLGTKVEQGLENDV